MAAQVDRRQGCGEWITSARELGRRALLAWIVVGWVIFIPLAFYLGVTGKFGGVS